MQDLTSFIYIIVMTNTKYKLGEIGATLKPKNSLMDLIAKYAENSVQMVILETGFRLSTLFLPARDL